MRERLRPDQRVTLQSTPHQHPAGQLQTFPQSSPFSCRELWRTFPMGMWRTEPPRSSSRERTSIGQLKFALAARPAATDQTHGGRTHSGWGHRGPEVGAPEATESSARPRHSTALTGQAGARAWVRGVGGCVLVAAGDANEAAVLLRHVLQLVRDADEVRPHLALITPCVPNTRS